MKIILLLLAFVNGAFMLTDGIFVIVNRKYIGPEKPGPWAAIFSAFGVDVFKLGPMFVVFGVAWLVFVLALFMDQRWAHPFGVGLSIATLWYLPFGTLISVVALVLLLFFRERLSGK
jgi:hypothetical protein